jgi:hypothetical protein
MSPYAVVDDIQNGLFGDIKLRGEAAKAGAPGGVSRPNGDDFRLGQLGPVVFFAPWAAAAGATLLDHVSDVVFSSAQEQMVWADASGGVTFMAHIQFDWQCTEMKFPGEPVCPNNTIGPAAFLNNAVSAPRFRPGPKPTIGGLDDVSPEASFKVCPLSCFHVGIISPPVKREY